MSTELVTITEAAIKRYATTKVKILHDQQLRPLYFRYHSGRTSGTWYLVGRQFEDRWHKIGRWPEVSASVIRKEAHKLLVVDSEQTIETGKTLGDVLTWYRDRNLHNTQITPERQADVDGMIKNHLLPKADLVTVPIDSIQKFHIDAYLFLTIQATMKPATINKVFRVLKQATRTAHRLDVIGRDPLAGYRFSDFMNATLDPKPSALRPADAAQVIEQVLAARGLHPKASLLAGLMLLHGTRINETRLANWRDLDLTERWWHIPAAHTKNRKPIRLPLTPIACQFIEQYRPANPGRKPVFNGNGNKPISRGHASTLIQRVSQREWTAHDLRKLARTVWRDIGVDYLIGELLLNHTPTKLDRTYMHDYADQKCREGLENYHHWLNEASKNTLLSGRYALERAKKEES